MAPDLGQGGREGTSDVEIKWSLAALDDLKALRDYIGVERPVAAALVAERILKAVEELKVFPHRGRAGRVSATRELVVRRTPFVIAYRVGESRVEIQSHAAPGGLPRGRRLRARGTVRSWLG